MLKWIAIGAVLLVVAAGLAGTRLRDGADEARSRVTTVLAERTAQTRQLLAPSKPASCRSEERSDPGDEQDSDPDRETDPGDDSCQSQDDGSDSDGSDRESDDNEEGD